MQALRSAKENNKSRYDKLSVQCRGKTKSKFIFLIKKDSKILAQCQVDEEFLLNRSNQLGDFTKTEKIRKYLTMKARTATASSIKDLRTGMHHVSLKAKVLEVTEPKQVATRHGNRASVAKALIADETGTIKLCLWNTQITSVSTGDTVQIENAQVFSFRGEKNMSLGKKEHSVTLKSSNPKQYQSIR